MALYEVGSDGTLKKVAGNFSSFNFTTVVVEEG